MADHLFCGTFRSHFTPSVSITFDVEEVTLDFRDGQMTISGTLHQVGGAPPEVVWVWPYFTNPDLPIPGSWSDKPIKLLAPFARGPEARVSARGHFHWWNNSDAPRGGYYAHVHVSAADAHSVAVPPPAREYGLEGAVAVRSLL